MATLEVMSGKSAGQKFEVNLGAGDCTLGNRRQANVVLKDTWISFTHAVITKAKDGTVLIADKRSKTGTFLNGEKVDERGRPLKDGDTIALGQTQLKFVDKESPGAAAAPKSAADVLTPPEPPVQSGPFTRAPSGPFSQAAPAAAGSTRPASELEAELKRAQAEAQALRTAVAAREKALAEAQAKIRALEDKAKAAPAPPPPPASAGPSPAEVEKKLAAVRAALEDQLESAQAEAQAALARAVAAESEAVRLKHVGEETVAKARIKIEELQRHAQTLEARLTQGGKADTVAQERELATLREEARRLREAAKQRIDALTLEKSALEAQLAEAKAAPPAPVAAGSSAADSARIADLEQQLADAERSRAMLDGRVTELETKLEDAQETIRRHQAPVRTGPSGAEEMAALEGAIAELNRDLAAAREELERKDAELERLRAGGAAPAAAAPAPPGGGAAGAGDPEKIAALEKERDEALAELQQVRKDLEEINEDMLAQEEEYQGRIAALERQLEGK